MEESKQQSTPPKSSEEWKKIDPAIVGQAITEIQAQTGHAPNALEV